MKINYRDRIPYNNKIRLYIICDEKLDLFIGC